MQTAFPSRADMASRILSVAERLAARDGPRAVVVRTIASEVGCSVGAVYNSVGDLSRIVMGVNLRTLARLRDRIGSLPGGQGVDAVLAMARAYIAFVGENPGLWRMVVDEEAATSGQPRPETVNAILGDLIGTVDAAATPIVPDAADRMACVATLWASLQGIASLRASGKLSAVGEVDPDVMVETLVRRFLSGGPVAMRRG